MLTRLHLVPNDHCYREAVMSTAAQAFANKMNAQASTGPTTPEGKAASSRNATSHGLSGALFALLPGESAFQYQASLNSFTRLFRPANIHETHLVELMVQSKWKLARAQRMEAALVAQMVQADPVNKVPEAAIAAALLAGTAGPYKTLQRYQAAAERSYYKAHRELAALQAEKAPVQNEPKSATYPTPRRPYKEPHHHPKFGAKPQTKPTAVQPIQGKPAQRL